MFYDTLNGGYIVYEGTRWHIISGLYVNSYGLSTYDVFRSNHGDKSRDMRMFSLDYDKLKTVRRDLIEMKVLDQIISRNIIDNEKYIEGYY